MNGNVVTAGIFNAAQHQHLRATCGHLEHLFERDRRQVAGVRDDAGISGVDAVHVGVDLADIGVESRGKCHGGGVGPTTPQRGDVLGVLRDTLEARDENDLALVERRPYAAGRDVDDLGLAMAAGGDHTRLRTGERLGFRAEGADCHRDQRVRDALTRGEQHVHLAGRRRRADLLGEVEQLVGGVAHRRHHDHHVVARLTGRDDALGHSADPFGVANRGAAVLLHDQSHRVSLL